MHKALFFSFSLFSQHAFKVKIAHMKARDAILTPVQKSLDIVLKKWANDHHS
jgi:hypothetical protein